MQTEAAFLHHLLQIDEHALADPGNGQNLFGLTDDFRNLLRQAFNRFGGISIRTNAKRVLAVDLEKIGGLVQNPGNGLVVHRARLNNSARRCRGSGLSKQNLAG